MPTFYRDLVPYLVTYKTGTAVACGTTSTMVPVPTNANSAFIHAEGAAIYWNVGGASAGTGSPGYVPADSAGFIFPCDNLGTGLPVIGGAVAAIAHIEFIQG
jgi:hypothetical protein